MTTKDEYLAKLKTQLDEWQADLEHLKTKADVATGEAKVKIHEQLAELREKWDEGHARREEILAAADEKWDDIKEEVEDKWGVLKAGMADSIDRIKAHFKS
jgi:hypothetical protein